MRRLLVSNLMSLDAFFAGPNGDLGWHVADAEFFAYAAEMLRSVDTILFGRITYEIMVAHWPSAPKDEIADKMNGLAKVVFSKTLAKVDWNNTTLLKGDLINEVSNLKRLPGKDYGCAREREYRVALAQSRAGG